VRFGGKFALLLGLFSISGLALAADVAILRNGFSIPNQRHAVMGTTTRLYLGNDDSSFVDVPTGEIDRFENDLSVPAGGASSNPRKLDEVINSISGRHHLDPDLVNSVIHAESGFNPRAVSPKGAQGLMQLMPNTASTLGVNNAFDPAANVEGGTRYLRELLERYNFDLIKALAAYNAGPQRVAQYGGLPPYFETQTYVSRVIKDFNRKKRAERQAAKTPTARVKKAALHGAPGPVASALPQPASR